MIKTTKFNLPIVRRKATKGLKILGSVGLLLVLLLIISLILNDNNQQLSSITGIILILILLTSLIYVFRSFNVEEFERIGYVTITINSLEIRLFEQTLIYSIADLKLLKIKLIETSEDSTITSGLHALMNKEGINNEIEIIDNEGNRSSYQVYVKNQSWIRLVNRILTQWPKDKVLNMNCE
jgi:hypothetical protein